MFAIQFFPPQIVTTMLHTVNEFIVQNMGVAIAIMGAMLGIQVAMAAFTAATTGRLAISSTRGTIADYSHFGDGAISSSKRVIANYDRESARNDRIVKGL